MKHHRSVEQSKIKKKHELLRLLTITNVNMKHQSLRS